MAGNKRKVEEIMTMGCEAVAESESILAAATLMKRQDIGALPIKGDGGQLKGMLTDRDIVTEVICEGLDPAATKAGSLSGDLVVAHTYDDLEEAMETMSTRQIRRLPVIDGDGMLVGMVSQGDIAVHADSESSGRMLASVSAA